MYRTTANRLRRIAIASALTIGASGGALAGTLTVLGTGTNGPVSAAAISHTTSSSSKASHTVVATAVPVVVSQATATSATTSPSGTVSTKTLDS
jgi:hypothetical protein